MKNITQSADVVFQPRNLVLKNIKPLLLYENFPYINMHILIFLNIGYINNVELQLIGV